MFGYVGAPAAVIEPPFLADPTLVRYRHMFTCVNMCILEGMSQSMRTKPRVCGMSCEWSF